MSFVVIPSADRACWHCVSLTSLSVSLPPLRNVSQEGAQHEEERAQQRDEARRKVRGVCWNSVPRNTCVSVSQQEGGGSDSVAPRPRFVPPLLDSRSAAPSWCFHVADTAEEDTTAVRLLPCVCVVSEEKRSVLFPRTECCGH